jgi:hypothetical protein
MEYLGEEKKKKSRLFEGCRPSSQQPPDIEDIEGKRATHRNLKLPCLIQANTQFLLHNGSPLDPHLVPARGNLAATKKTP